MPLWHLLPCLVPRFRVGCLSNSSYLGLCIESPPDPLSRTSECYWVSLARKQCVFIMFYSGWGVPPELQTVPSLPCRGIQLPHGNLNSSKIQQFQGRPPAAAASIGTKLSHRASRV